MEDQTTNPNASANTGGETPGDSGSSHPDTRDTHDSSPMQRMQRILTQTSEKEAGSWDSLLADLPEDARSILASAPPNSLNQPETQTTTPPSGSNITSATPDPDEVKVPTVEQAAGPAPIDEQISGAEALAQSMRDRGYLIEEDATGIRLSGAPVRRGSQSSMMSASELVQLAAEMDGGILPPEERIHCPHCDAVIKPGENRCPWCSKSLDAPPEPED